MVDFNLTLADTQNSETVFNLGLFKNSQQFTNLSRYNYFTMLLVTNGKGQVIRDEIVYSFKSNCLLCFSIYQPFKIIADNDFEGIFITFHPSFFCLFKHRNEVSCNGVLFNNLYDSPVVYLTADETASLTVVAGEMQRELAGHENPDHDIILSFLKIFLTSASRIKKSQQQDTLRKQEYDNPMVIKLRDAIEQQFRQMHSPVDYANLLYVSTDVLNNVAKKYLQKTLTNLIAERLIIEAKRELYLTGKAIKEIAFELGYRDEFYFSRFFKKHTGVSPALFRNSVGFNKLEAANDE